MQNKNMYIPIVISYVITNTLLKQEENIINNCNYISKNIYILIVMYPTCRNDETSLVSVR